MIRRWSGAMVALLMLAVLSSCNFMRGQAFAEPDVLVSDVRLTGGGLQGAKIDIVLSVYNPNNFRLDASSLHFKAYVDTVLLAQGTVEPRVTLPPKDSTEIKVPATVSLPDFGHAMQLIFQRGEVPFRITGDVKVETPVGSVMRPFDQHGTVDSGLNVSILPRKR